MCGDAAVTSTYEKKIVWRFRYRHHRHDTSRVCEVIEILAGADVERPIMARIMGGNVREHFALSLRERSPAEFQGVLGSPPVMVSQSDRPVPVKAARPGLFAWDVAKREEADMSCESGPMEEPGFDDCTVPETNVSVYDALYRRRMAWDFKDQPVPRDALAGMLDTAIWAPNHRLTEPWRFSTLEQGSTSLEKAAGLAHDFALQRSGNAQRAEATRGSLLKTPVIIYMYSTPGRDEEDTRENNASVCCAAHNIALAGVAGVAEGLAVTWETGGPTRLPDPAKTLGAEDDWDLATMLSIGYPAEDPPSQRIPVSNFVQRLE